MVRMEEQVVSGGGKVVEDMVMEEVGGFTGLFYNK